MNVKTAVNHALNVTRCEVANKKGNQKFVIIENSEGDLLIEIKATADRQGGQDAKIHHQNQR